MKRTTLIILAAWLVLPLRAQKADVPVATGPYSADWESLAAWECPEWFRDVKFGIWAHWDPQCQAEAGDWYARFMYYPGDWKYNWHVEHFGNPATYGYKELCRDWKAEQWNPDELIALYYSAGARYFMAMGNHHDNFDCWNSPYQEWNSMNVGPKRDIVGGWAEACRKQGMRLGVSFHASHTWTWMEPSQRYDGNLTKEDGTGTWWEGLDPQELYAQRHTHSTGWDNAGTIHSQWNWGNGASQPSQAYKQKFQNRVLQCVNDYRPDMIYFDDTVLPFWGCDESIGLNILQHYYNTSAALDGTDKAEVVVTGKVLQDMHKQAMMWDVERGIPDRCQEMPWQTCTCIGDWHYERGIYERGGYKSAEQVIRMLVDIVSKNGNMLLSIPVRGSGVIDEKERAIVMGIKAWMDINSTSIYGTRPWKVYGEGPLFESSNPLNAQGFNEGINYSSADVRYVERNDTVFATIMRWPELTAFTFKSLGLASPYYAGKVMSVKLLGGAEVPFEQGVDGLRVSLPLTHPNEIAPVLVIAFDPTAPKSLSLEELIDIYSQKADELAAQASHNTGKPNALKVAAFARQIDDARSLLAASEEEQAEAASSLHRAYETFRQTGFNPAGAPDEVGMTDVTLEYLLEKNNFAATDMGTRFGKPVNWTVENFSIPQLDASRGTKNGIDNYPGRNDLMMGKWSGEDGTPASNMTNARIYRQVRLPAGHYFFGAAFNALYQLGTSYIYVASEPLTTTAILRESIARITMSRCSTDGQFYGITFDLDEEQDVVLVFQANMQGGNANQEFRVDEVKLLYSDSTDDLTQTDITEEMLVQASRFARISGQSTSTRYGTPANWTVENYAIPAGNDGTRKGLDRYPGYDCLTLGVWDDRQNNTQGNLSNARVYRRVALDAGRYYFGAAYEANYQLSQAYIFASSETLDTGDIPAQSIAYDLIADAGKDNTTFRGIYFEMPEPQEVLLGFQADLASGATQQEFRASKVKLVRYGKTNAIEEVRGDALKGAAVIYDLSGRRVTTPTKGVYIIGGREVMVR
ncbi:MAG: alpha-L-fucosidase [Bacteroidaceae bacterium]|nr:alpha-L-fucosidase [Bacteroidaceae bacterium]